MKFFALTILLCTFSSASDSSKKSKKPTADKHDSSRLESVESVMQQAATEIKTLIKSIAKLPEESFRCESKFDTAASAKSQLVLAGRMASGAQLFLPSKSAARKQIKSLNQSLRDRRTELEPYIEKTTHGKKKRMDKKKKSSTDDEKDVGKSFITYGSYRVQAAKDIISAIQSINISAFSFKELCKLSVFLISFSNYLAVFKEEDILAFESNIQSLKNRKTELDLQASGVDWENFDKTYSDNSEKLLELLTRVIIAPKGTKLHKLSDALISLADAVADYANLSSTNDDVLKEVDALVKEERKNSKLYSDWRRIKGIQDSSITDSEDNRSDSEEGSSDS